MKRWWFDAQKTEDERTRREARITIPKPAPGDRNNPDSDRIILAVGAIAEQLANPSGLTLHKKVRHCVNDPDNTATEAMEKALAVIGDTLAELAAAPVPVPPKRRRLPRTLNAGRPAPVRPFVGARPAAQPPAAAAAPVSATPRFVGPSGRHHLDDGRTVDLSWWNFRDRLAGDLRSGHVSPDPAAIIDHAADHYGLNRGDASELTERFLDSVHRDLERRGA